LEQCDVAYFTFISAIPCVAGTKTTVLGYTTEGVRMPSYQYKLLYHSQPLEDAEAAEKLKYFNHALGEYDFRKRELADDILAQDFMTPLAGEVVWHEGARVIALKVRVFLVNDPTTKLNPSERRDIQLSAFEKFLAEYKDIDPMHIASAVSDELTSV